MAENAEAETERAEGENPNGEQQAQHNGHDHQQGQPAGENGEVRRRRRRRRGRRGGRDRVEHGAHGDTLAQGEGIEHHQTGFANEADRFGAVPDEIDTTPTDVKHAPGAPSAPVWSLQDDIPDTTPSDEQAKKEDGPKKKGWWQRTFSGE